MSEAMRQVFTKSDMISAVHNLRWKDVRAGILQRPDLIGMRDRKGRNWLHLCCAVDIRTRGLTPTASVRTAGILLDGGLDINQEAFRDGQWKATPLWFAIAFGRNLPLAKYLLQRGSDSNHCLWAAAYNDDASALRLLIRHGAECNPSNVLLAAVQWNRLAAAAALLKLGAEPNAQDKKGMTALHYALNKRDPAGYVRLLLKYGARMDIKDARGITAEEMLSRKRDSALRALAGRVRNS